MNEDNLYDFLDYLQDQLFEIENHIKRGDFYQVAGKTGYLQAVVEGLMRKMETSCENDHEENCGINGVNRHDE